MNINFTNQKLASLTEVIRTSAAKNKSKNEYKDQMEGERLAMFTSDGFLEISINQGRASSLLGINLFDSIRIEFKLWKIF